MSSYKFTAAQRYAICKVFDFKCRWCLDPFDSLNFQVDHVIPESLLQEPDQLKHILESFSRTISFNINDYENWVPLHPKCNNSKSNKVFEGAAKILEILEECEEKKPQAKDYEKKINKIPTIVKLISQITIAIEEKLLTQEDLKSFIITKEIDNLTEESIEYLNYSIEFKIFIRRFKYFIEKIKKDLSILEAEYTAYDNDQERLNFARYKNDPWIENQFKEYDETLLNDALKHKKIFDKKIAEELFLPYEIIGGTLPISHYQSPRSVEALKAIFDDLIFIRAITF